MRKTRSSLEDGTGARWVVAARGRVLSSVWAGQVGAERALRCVESDT